MATYRVIYPLRHGGKRHVSGEQVELEDKQAQPLLAAGVIQVLPDAPSQSPNANSDNAQDAVTAEAAEDKAKSNPNANSNQDAVTAEVAEDKAKSNSKNKAKAQDKEA